MAIYKLNTPISEEEVRKLYVNDIIYITGTIITARDQAHKRALDYIKQGKPLPVSFEGLAIYHCGPVVSKVGDKWTVVAAGPTTSTRMETLEYEFIENFKARVIIGKGGMGRRTVEAMKRFGVVYGAFVGGAGTLAAKAIKAVKGVEWLDLGVPEALWILNVEDFGPLIVAIDSHGNNLFEEAIKRAEERKPLIYEKLGV